MKATCPNNSEHKRFTTTAIEIHDWLVDQDGEFIRDLGCSQVYEYPDKLNSVWTCTMCDAEATFEIA
jgi:hypothetical protein